MKKLLWMMISQAKGCLFGEYIKNKKTFDILYINSVFAVVTITIIIYYVKLIRIL